MRLAAVIFILAASLSIFAQDGPGAAAPPPGPEKPSKSIIRGKVIYEDTGRPVRRGPIGLIAMPDAKAPGNDLNGAGAGDLSKKVLTDAEGNFTIDGVRAGTYLPDVDMPGVLTPGAYLSTRLYARSASDLDFLYEFFEPIKVDGLSDFPIVVRVKRGAAIAGKISYVDGAPAIGVEVEVLRMGESGYVSVSGDKIGVVKADDRGIYRMAGLLPGQYIVRVTEVANYAAHGQDDTNSPLKTYFPDASTALAAAKIKLDLGQEQEGIDITLPDNKLFVMSGSVVRKNDRSPVPGAQVTLEKIDDEDIVEGARAKQPDVFTDEKGNWAFKHLPPGKYRLGVPQTGGSRASAGKDDKARPLASVSHEVTIDAADPDKVVIEVPVQSTVSGKLSISGKGEIPNALFVLALDPKSKGLVGMAFTNLFEDESEKARSDKSTVPFKLERLREGRYSLYVSPLEKFYVKSIVAGGVDLMTTPLELKEGEDIRDVQIVISSDVAILKGVVLDNEKSPVRNAVVGLLPVDAKRRAIGTTITGAAAANNGEFELRAAPGEYYIIAAERIFRKPTDESPEEAMGKLIKNADKVTLKAGDNAPITVRLYVP